MSDHAESSTALPPGTPPDAGKIGPAFVLLCEVIAKLRSPEGCPWDRRQTLASIKPYTLEETYELLEAIDSDENEAISEELGDLLLQVVLDAQIAADEGRFDLIAVVEGITEKMVRRHPHVFGEASAESTEDVSRHWDTAKRNEKQRESVLDGVPKDLPALARASRLSKKAARVGYDFPHRDMLFDKLREELDELTAELFPDGCMPEMSATVDAEVTPDQPLEDAAVHARIEGELGDVLFVLANIARRWNISPEEALRKSNAKFERRFRNIERCIQQRGKDTRETTLQEMEAIYQEGKRREKELRGES